MSAAERGTSHLSLTPAGLQGYFRQSAQPLTSLMFLLPMLLFHEIGTWYYAFCAGQAATQRPVLAFNFLHRFFAMFGATGVLLPALAVVAILFAQHLFRRDRWRISGLVLSGMLLESVLLTAPLLILFETCPDGPVRWRNVVDYIGAGVYEELLFRLIAFTVLVILLVDMCKIPKNWAYPSMVVSTAIVFAGYHYLGKPIVWHTFAFRATAGAYLGVIFLLRGFGVTAGAHVVYNLIFLTRLAIAPDAF